MDDQLNSFLVSLSEFLLFFVVAVGLTVVFTLAYTRVTRHNEFALIKEKSIAAAVAFAGSVMGFALPLASAMTQSVTVVEMLLWGLVALIVQLLVYQLIRLPMPRISERIETNEVAAGIWLGTCSLVAGILSAASMTT